MSNKNKPQHHQQKNQQQHTAHMIKPVQDTVPPRYQPPPQPTTGILKHHPHFQPPSSSQTNISTAVINGLHVNQNHQLHRISTGVHQTQKDAHSKFPAKIVAEHVTTAQLPPSVKTNHGYIQAKVPQGQLPPASQYPLTQQVARHRITDEDFLRLGPVEMLKFVRKTETDISRVANEQNRQIQTLVRCVILLSQIFITHSTII